MNQGKSAWTSDAEMSAVETASCIAVNDREIDLVYAPESLVDQVPSCSCRIRRQIVSSVLLAGETWPAGL